MTLLVLGLTVGVAGSSALATGTTRLGDVTTRTTALCGEANFEGGRAVLGWQRASEAQRLSFSMGRDEIGFGLSAGLSVATGGERDPVFGLRLGPEVFHAAVGHGDLGFKHGAPLVSHVALGSQISGTYLSLGYAQDPHREVLFVRAEVPLSTALSLGIDGGLSPQGVAHGLSMSAGLRVLFGGR